MSCWGEVMLEMTSEQCVAEFRAAFAELAEPLGIRLTGDIRREKSRSSVLYWAPAEYAGWPMAVFWYGGGSKNEGGKRHTLYVSFRRDGWGLNGFPDTEVIFAHWTRLEDPVRWERGYFIAGEMLR